MHAPTTAHHTTLRRLLPALALVVSAASAVSATAQETHGAHAAHGAPKRPAASGRAPLLKGMGSYHHAITTSKPLAQRYFDQGLSLAYAFNHAEARASFEQAARLDPGCAMCHWGIAYVLGPNINAPMDTSANREAHAAAQRARALAPRATPRERAYIDAMARRYSTQPSATRAGLDSAYAAAMRAVAERFPDDADAATLFAEAQMDLSPWVYWSKERTPLPGTTELLDALGRAMRRDPNHPGACHFFIHAVEAVDPARAVPCAERLAALMPGAGHIVHMPAHIYLRVGRYDDAITANEHAVHADERYIADQRVQGFYTIAYYPHNLHFLAFAATMAGRSEKAVASARAAASKITAEVARGVPELQLLVAYPHLTLATFGRWDEVLREPVPAADLVLAQGLAWYARGAALAATGRVAEAAGALDSVRAAGAAVTTYPGAPVLQIAARVLGGEIARRRGDVETALAELRAAVELEDGLTYMEPPYWHQPVRHVLGAALLDANRAAEAERMFRQDLERFPDNVWSLRGLARSLDAQGRTGDAARVRERLDRGM